MHESGADLELASFIQRWSKRLRLSDAGDSAASHDQVLETTNGHILGSNANSDVDETAEFSRNVQVSRSFLLHVVVLFIFTFWYCAFEC